MDEVIEEVILMIDKSKQMIVKFAVNTPQHSLLNHRIKALEIVQFLIENKSNDKQYSLKEFDDALPVILSIISKCSKAQTKFKEGSYHFISLDKKINAMKYAKQLIEKEL